ncbi:MAG: hypothetical protein ACJ72E_11995 [Marmoricola sp.]
MERVVEGTGSPLPTMLRAALPAVPGLNLLPGVAKKGGELPDLTLTRKDVAVDLENLAAYREVCGFGPSQHLPFNYPHTLAFPLHMGIMTDSSFPYAAIGSVHLSNTMTRHRLIAPSERLDVSATATNKRAHPKGTIFDLVTTVTAAGTEEVVWDSVSTYLRPGPGDADARPEGEPFEVVAGNGTEWKLPADLGRRFAAVSGDYTGRLRNAKNRNAGQGRPCPAPESDGSSSGNRGGMHVAPCMAPAGDRGARDREGQVHS